MGELASDREHCEGKNEVTLLLEARRTLLWQIANNHTYDTVLATAQAYAVLCDANQFNLSHIQKIISDAMDSSVQNNVND